MMTEYKDYTKYVFKRESGGSDSWDLSADDHICHYLCYKGHGSLTLCACLLLLVLFGRFGFYKYMKMDEEEDDRPFFFPNPDGIY